MPESKKALLKEKFASDEFPIHIMGRHLEITEPMKNYAVEKLRKIQRFGGRVIDATVVMDIQKLSHNVDFILDVNNTKVKVSGHSDNMYTSIDLAIGHLETKLRKYHQRLTEHHAKKPTEIEMNVSILAPDLSEINDQIEEVSLDKIEAELGPHQIVSREKKVLKLLTQNEAVMKMDLSSDVFLLYRSEEDRKLKVIYRRNDGNYGIIEAE